MLPALSLLSRVRGPAVLALTALLLPSLAFNIKGNRPSKGECNKEFQ
jgi:hypothetical protein